MYLETYKFLWLLMLVSTNHALSNSGQEVKQFSGHYLMLSFDIFFPSFSLAESLPCDLQITAYK